MFEQLLGQIASGSVTGPLLGLALGILLGVSPLALPMVPAVVSMGAPGRLDDGGVRTAPSLLRLVPSIISFTAGMNGVLGVVGYLFVTVTVVLARAAIVLNVVAAVVMAVLGLRLLLRRTSLCKRATAIPPKPGAAFVYGIAYSVGGCPACGPIALGVGSAAALMGGPVYALAVIAAFVLGHAAVLIAATGLGARLLPNGTADVPWLRLDLVVGAMFMLASAFYVYRLVTGKVTTRLPGEPGSGLLP